MKPAMQMLSEYRFSDGYSTSSQSLLEEFYKPALERSDHYFRSAGYFSSSLFAIAPIAYANFVAGGGRMKLLCSPHLSGVDAEYFSSLSPSSAPTPRALAEKSLLTLKESGNLENALVRVLSNLISSGVLEVQFVIYRTGNLFHDKVGIFQDSEGNLVTFLGSANETHAAWSGIGNHEQIEVFSSWRSEESRTRAERHLALFEETWQGLRRGLQVIPAPESAEIIQASAPPGDLESSLAEVRSLLKSRSKVDSSESKTLRPYQQEVLKNWEKFGRSGIVRFATGGGKTLTAISAIRDWVGEGRPALVLVPSELLHSQWEAAIREELADVPILKVGAGANRRNWLENLSGYTADDSESGPRIVLSTYQSAVTDSFITRIRDGDHLLLVADEVHRLGAPDTRILMEKIRSGARLGLSATPERFGDPEGTDRIFDFFERVLEPGFSLADAIKEQVLVEYDYRLEVCQLNDDEQERWDSLSSQLGQDFARNGGELSELGKHLLRQRATVGKRAAEKAGVARRVLSSNVKPGDRWLVYCNDRAHLTEVREAIRDLGLDVMEYHTQNSPDHQPILDYFVNEGGVLLAIKCLDEGIDIPAINKALILASSTNPREYIQRRGRVLRRSPGKYSAQIFDVAVVDSEGLPLTPSEVIRAEEFAHGARDYSSKFEIERLRLAMSEAGAKLEDRTDFEEDSELVTGLGD